MLEKIAVLLACSLAVAAFAADEGPRRAGAAQSDDGQRSAVTLRGSDGQVHAPLADHGQRATVLLFLMHDCPVTNASAPELARLARDFTSAGVQFFRVYATESAAEIDAHGRDYGLQFTGLLDPALELARLTGATRAPEAAVISPAGVLLYRGRIDDRAMKPGVTRPTASRCDLRLALEAVLAGREPESRFTPAVGCYLPVK